MAFVHEDRTSVPRSWLEHSARPALFGGITKLLQTLLAGMVASKEYRHLNSLTDEQLGHLRLKRRDIDQEIAKRHFSEL